MTNCRYANVSDVQIHTEIHLCIVRIYIYIRVSTSCAYTYTRERRTSPSSLASPRFSSSCTSTPSFFCLALAPSRYSRRITELRTKIEGNGSHCSSRISTLFLALFPPSTVFPTAFLDLSQKFRPSPIIGWIISIRYIYKTSVKLNSFVDLRRRRRSGEVIDAV